MKVKLGIAMLINHSQLPPKIKPNKRLADRVYRTAIRPDLFLKLEVEAQERGVTPYMLTQIVMTMYLEGRMISIDDLPADSPLTDEPLLMDDPLLTAALKESY